MFPPMNEWLFPLLAGAVTGVLSGFGVGGGTLLLVYMTVFAGLDQHLAQGINLLYFLPAGLMALPAHLKKRLRGQAGAPARHRGGAGAGRPGRLGGHRPGRGGPAQVLRGFSDHCGNYGALWKSQRIRACVPVFEEHRPFFFLQTASGLRRRRSASRMRS